MADRIIKLSDDFWNIRGSFRIAGVLNIGTQASLVRRPSGTFILVDSYPLTGEIEREIAAHTRGGADIEAVLNLHPFHTVHTRAIHEQYPHATLYGSDRHVRQAPELPWNPTRINDPALHEQFADVLEFSVPAGVDFISKNEAIHFSSVLAFHRTTGTIHVDDTFNYIRFPKAIGWFGFTDQLSFHPTLSSALEPRAGAAADFRAWAQDLAERWKSAENLCSAHVGVLRAAKNPGAPIYDRMLTALQGVERTLKAHQAKHG